MSVTSNSLVLPPAAIRTLILMGGDTSAMMEAGTEDNPATRGAHLLVRYTAPLNEYYENWHGRALHALNTYATNRRGALLTVRDTVSAAMGSAAQHVSANWNLTGNSMHKVNVAVGSAGGLADAGRRFRLHHAASQVAVATIGAKHGEDRHLVDYDDARGLQSAVLEVFAAQGVTSAELLSNAVSSTGQIQEVRHAQRAYLEQASRYETDRAMAAAESKAKRNSGIGSLLSVGASVVGAFL